MKKTIISIALCLALLLYCCIISSSAQNVSEDTNYRLMVLQDGTYQCDFLDNNNNIIHTEQTPKYPDVRRLSSGYILYKVQAGTGVGTNWGFFYDSSRVRLSDTFYGIMDTEDGLFISIRNTSPPVYIPETGVPETTKESLGHGYGLNTVIYTLKQLEAEYTFAYEGGWFQFVAEIPAKAHNYT